MESLLGQTLMLSCMTGFLEKLSSSNKQIPEGVLNTISFSLVFSYNNSTSGQLLNTPNGIASFLNGVVPLQVRFCVI